MTREQLDGLLEEIRQQQREHSDLDAQLLESEARRRNTLQNPAQNSFPAPRAPASARSAQRAPHPAAGDAPRGGEPGEAAAGGDGEHAAGDGERRQGPEARRVRPAAPQPRRRGAPAPRARLRACEPAPAAPALAPLLWRTPLC